MTKDGVLTKILMVILISLIVGVVIFLYMMFVSPFISPTVGDWQKIWHGKEDKGYYTQCIEADDFGYPRYEKLYAMPNKGFSVSNNTYGQSYHSVFDSNGIVAGSAYNQITKWEDTRLVLTGQPLLIKTEGRWTSWFRGSFKSNGLGAFAVCKYLWRKQTPDLTQDSLFYCPRLADNWQAAKDTLFIGSNNIDQHRGDAIYINVNDDDFKTPCWFTNGYSAYMLTAPKGVKVNGKDSDRSIYNIQDIVSPQFNTTHLFGYTILDNTAIPSTNTTGAYKRNYVLSDLYLSSLPQGSSAGDRIWVKLYDRYYEDNEGRYVIKFKQGVRTDSVGPIKKVLDTVTTFVNDIAKTVYKSFVSNYLFNQFVTLILTLYVTIYGTMILMGKVKISQGDLVFRGIKIALIMQLLSPASWEFFNQYLFQIFRQASSELVCYMARNAGISACDSTAQGAPSFFDDSLEIFFAEETWAKILSSALQGADGIIIVAAFVFAIIMFVMSLFWVLIVYTLAVIPIALLIIISPIFFVMMLFETTKMYFNNWLKDVASYTLQTLLAILALVLFSTTALQFMKRTVGYRVCWKCIACPKIDFTGVCNALNALGANINVDDCTYWVLGFSFGEHPKGWKAWQADIRWTPQSFNVCVDANDPRKTIPGFRCSTPVSASGDNYYNSNVAWYTENSNFAGTNGYVYLDWTKNANLDFVYRNPIDMPYYDPLDVDANSPNGYYALRKRLNDSDIVSLTLVLVFAGIVFIFRAFIKQIPSIAQEIADSRFGINLGASADSYNASAGSLFKMPVRIGRAVNNRLNIGDRIMHATKGLGMAMATDSMKLNYRNIQEKKIADDIQKLENKLVKADSRKEKEELMGNLERRRGEQVAHKIMYEATKNASGTGDGFGQNKIFANTRNINEYVNEVTQGITGAKDNFASQRLKADKKFNLDMTNTAKKIDNYQDQVNKINTQIDDREKVLSTYQADTKEYSDAAKSIVQLKQDKDEKQKKMTEYEELSEELQKKYLEEQERLAQQALDSASNKVLQATKMRMSGDLKDEQAMIETIKEQLATSMMAKDELDDYYKFSVDNNTKAVNQMANTGTEEQVWYLTKSAMKSLGKNFARLGQAIGRHAQSGSRAAQLNINDRAEGSTLAQGLATARAPFTIGAEIGRGLASDGVRLGARGIRSLYGKAKYGYDAFGQKISHRLARDKVQHELAKYGSAARQLGSDIRNRYIELEHRNITDPRNALRESQRALELGIVGRDLDAKALELARLTQEMRRILSVFRENRDKIQSGNMSNKEIRKRIKDERKAFLSGEREEYGRGLADIKRDIDQLTREVQKETSPNYALSTKAGQLEFSKYLALSKDTRAVTKEVDDLFFRMEKNIEQDKAKKQPKATIGNDFLDNQVTDLERGAAMQPRSRNNSMKKAGQKKQAERKELMQELNKLTHLNRSNMEPNEIVKLDQQVDIIQNEIRKVEQEIERLKGSKDGE